MSIAATSMTPIAWAVSNLLHTPQRLVWNDFEDTFRGPVEWDVAGYVISVRTRGVSSSFVRRMLDAYGWGDEHALAPFIAAQAVYDEIWQMYDSQRRSSRVVTAAAARLLLLLRPVVASEKRSGTSEG